MTNTRKQFVSAFALSAAALFLGACKDKPPTTDPGLTDADGAAEASASGDERVKCFGINSCAGESVCAVNKPELGIEHVCAGENECKGKGWIDVSRSECETQEGEILGTL